MIIKGTSFAECETCERRNIMTTCIIVANASEASIYEAKNERSNQYTLIEKFKHPASRKKGEELLADRPGHFQTNHDARSAYEKSDPKQVEAEKFSCELAHHAKKMHSSNQFNHLILIMPAHIHGFFMKHFTCGFSNIEYISKDYTKLPMDELIKQININLGL